MSLVRCLPELPCFLLLNPSFLVLIVWFQRYISTWLLLWTYVSMILWTMLTACYITIIKQIIGIKYLNQMVHIPKKQASKCHMFLTIQILRFSSLTVYHSFQLILYLVAYYPCYFDVLPNLKRFC